MEDIIDLKNCVDVVRKAMTSEDYETAADYIQKYVWFALLSFLYFYPLSFVKVHWIYYKWT